MAVLAVALAAVASRCEKTKRGFRRDATGSEREHNKKKRRILTIHVYSESPRS